MALKTIMLRRSIDLKKKQLEELRTKDKDFETREKELETARQRALSIVEETVRQRTKKPRKPYLRKWRSLTRRKRPTKMR